MNFVNFRTLILDEHTTNRYRKYYWTGTKSKKFVFIIQIIMEGRTVLRPVTLFEIIFYPYFTLTLPLPLC